MGVRPAFDSSSLLLGPREAFRCPSFYFQCPGHERKHARPQQQAGPVFKRSTGTRPERGVGVSTGRSAQAYEGAAWGGGGGERNEPDL